jgi:diguanylate cyclase (GGDEF)-like protein/PAS domain S-box-containing protein
MIRQGEIFNRCVDHLFEGMFITDGEMRIVDFNRSAEVLTGLSREELIGRSLEDEILRPAEKERNEPAEPGINTRDGEALLHAKGGYKLPVKVRTLPLKGEDGTDVGAVSLFAEKTMARREQKKIRELVRMAFKDHLTGLVNRRYFETQLAVHVGEFKRFGWGFGVLMADVDHFKAFNDMYGHAAGDEMLKVAAAAMLKGSRENDVACRWGGEEFVMILVLDDAEVLGKVAERIRAKVTESSFEDGGEMLNATISVGATLFLPDDTAESVLKRADSLTYKSKVKGRNTVTIG